jgi:hypothetical protein
MNKPMSRVAGSAFGGKKLLFMLPLVALLAAGCSSSQQASNQPPVQTPIVQNTNPIPPTVSAPAPSPINSWPQNPISYTASSTLFTVNKKQINISQTFDPTYFANESSGCGTNNSVSYYENLFSKFSANDIGFEYDFKYNGQSQSNNTYVIKVIQNKLGYTALNDFQKDFNGCEAGDNLQPLLLNNSSLVFYNPCGSGFDDGSGLPQGCFVIKQFLDSSISLH